MGDVDVSDVEEPEALLELDDDEDQPLGEFVDEEIADLDARLDAQDARDDALAKQLSTLGEKVEDARRRAKRAEKMAAWGGLGYEDRIETALDELIHRARATSNGCAYITTAEEDRSDHQGNHYTRPGIYDLFDGAISKRSARNYISALDGADGISATDMKAGGWGGGADQRRLRIDLGDFLAAYGAEYDVRSVLDDAEEVAD